MPINRASWWDSRRWGEKKNELGALPRLLDQLDLGGRVVTGDAQFTQRKVCQRIVAKGHYFFAVKDNQPTLKEDICGHRGGRDAASGGPNWPARRTGGTAAVMVFGPADRLQRLAPSGPGMPAGAHHPREKRNPPRVGLRSHQSVSGGS